MMRLSIIAVVLTALASPTYADPVPKGTDFADEIRTLYRVAACGGDDAISDRFSTRMVDAHCKEMASVYKSYKKEWADQAEQFIGDLRPRDIPKTVVYPFGGGDLTSALVVYPDATEITTISLEAAGDVRVIDTIRPATLATDLDSISYEIRRLFHSAHSTTKSLQAASHSTIPGTVMFALAGLTVHDMEPVSLRYFDIEPDGKLTYVTNEELDKRVEEFAAAKRGKTPPSKITHYWYEQDSPFANIEIKYRPRGDAKAPLRTYRHIVANLDDPHMDKDDRVLKHLR
ncbi:MAG TPA: hypothetical protein VGO00_20345, partial [Kofleriaceae bacterium]|nr:hypothetical protein [Kofleriaceae bacterium]